jgi:hypothetical protein
MRWGSAFGAGISHEAAGFDPRRPRAVRIGGGQQDAQNRRIFPSGGLTQRGVQRRLAGIRRRAIHIRALLDEVLATTPVAVEAGAVQIEVFSECGQRFAIGEGFTAAVAGLPEAT